jgi:sulfate adenylyltransferase subunit 2
MSNYQLSHLDQLESEAIFIFREVAEQMENPVLLFSGGKDSITMVHLAYKAFWPAKIPFTLLHIDTGHNFPETIEFRDNLAIKYGVKMDIGYVQDSINRGTAREEKGPNPSRNTLQSITLLEKLEEGKYDAAFGGGRRDEEKARAKERFFSHRNEFGEWDPKNQRPELWSLYNGKKAVGESFRISLLVTGPKWMFGNISNAKISIYLVCILHTNAMWFYVTEHGLPKDLTTLC